MADCAQGRAIACDQNPRRDWRFRMAGWRLSSLNGQDDAAREKGTAGGARHSEKIAHRPFKKNTHDPYRCGSTVAHGARFLFLVAGKKTASGSKLIRLGGCDGHSGTAGRCSRKACRKRGLSAFSTACSTRARNSALGAVRPMASIAAGASRASRAMIASR